jgi:hypothetical protein
MGGAGSEERGAAEEAEGITEVAATGAGFCASRTAFPQAAARRAVATIILGVTRISPEPTPKSSGGRK